MWRRKAGGRSRSRIRIFLLLVSLALAAFHYLLPPKYFRQYFPPSDYPQCTEAEDCFRGIVTRVVDGDTLDVNGTRIRLVLVDAPERDARGGSASTQYLRQLCPVGSTAMVDPDDLQPTDNYGRMLAVVWCGGRRVNEEIIRSGHAELYRRFCRRSEFGQQPWAVELGCR